MNASWVEPGADPGGPTAAPDRESMSPHSHRRGMLAGLGVVGRSPVTIPVGSETTTAGPATDDHDDVTARHRDDAAVHSDSVRLSA